VLKNITEMLHEGVSSYYIYMRTIAPVSCCRILNPGSQTHPLPAAP